MRLSMVVELLLILLLVAFAAYGRVIGNDFPRFFFFFFFFLRSLTPILLMAS